MGYNEQKAKKMYELYVQGKACRKVYAAVEKDGKFIVLKNPADRKYKYSIAGGTVENNEDNIVAIKREILEELNINAEVVKSLGFLNWKQTWVFEGKEFQMPYQVEIFLTKFISYSNNNTLGLEGEFSKEVTVEEVSKEEMVQNVYEFIVGNFKF